MDEQRSWNIQLLVVYDKIQYTRDENGTTFCINEDNNIDNELYCAVSELPNHVYFINCGHSGHVGGVSTKLTSFHW
jgi:hypothetical protein